MKNKLMTFTLVLALLSPQTVFADELSDKQVELKDVREQILELNQKVETLEEEIMMLGGADYLGTYTGLSGAVYDLQKMYLTKGKDSGKDILVIEYILDAENVSSGNVMSNFHRSFEIIQALPTQKVRLNRVVSTELAHLDDHEAIENEKASISGLYQPIKVITGYELLDPSAPLTFKVLSTKNDLLPLEFIVNPENL
ncbi:hypothetical protein HZY88_07645 [Aerococcaceae bacterium DSM 111176]|nr:hypothetical protein [Aerococcaceae bacterium DSM 111176]